MIITRTPLRITLGGGGTDLPSYYEQHGGLVDLGRHHQVHLHLDQPHLHRRLLPEVLGAGAGRQAPTDDRAPDRPRGAAAPTTSEPGVEIVSTADIPSGTGLGSSGSFTVGLLRAVYAMRRDHVSAADLAEEACQIEIDRLGRPVGKQDQYIAAFGGIKLLRLRPGRHRQRRAAAALQPTPSTTSRSTC